MNEQDKSQSGAPTENKASNAESIRMSDFGTPFTLEII